MSYQQLNNKAKDDELLSADDERIRRLCADLKRVGAPSNFDFGVRARIAEGRPRAERHSSLLPALRYVLPLSLVLLLSGLIVFNAVFTNETETPLQISGTMPLVPVQTGNSPAQTAAEAVGTENTATTAPPLSADKNAVYASANTAAAPEPKVKPADRKFIAVKIRPNPSAKPPAGESKDDFGGTRTSTQKSSEVINPPGINPNPPVSEPENVSRETGISVKDALSRIGLETEFATSGWRVKAVTENSAAARAGIVAGDLIEAAGDNTLNTEIFSGRSLNFKVLQILRAGERLSVEIR